MDTIRRQSVPVSEPRNEPTAVNSGVQAPFQKTGATLPQTISGAEFAAKWANTLQANEADAMLEALNECRQINHDAWK